LARTALEVGAGRSRTLAALVESVEGSEFIVYVETSRRLKDGMQGCLVHGAAGTHYLRVILKTGLSLNERIEVLAHELQHVREVIQAGILNDPVAMQALFSRVGHNTRQRGARQQEYETQAARLVATMVARELRTNRPEVAQAGDRRR
jgi:predicted RNA-binding protein